MQDPLALDWAVSLTSKLSVIDPDKEIQILRLPDPSSLMGRQSGCAMVLGKSVAECMYESNYFEAIDWRT